MIRFAIINISGILLLLLLMATPGSKKEIKATGNKMFGVASELSHSAAQWSSDKEHSNITFSLDHLGITEVHGFFTNFDCTMNSSRDNFTDAEIYFTIDPNSIQTNSQARDQHLKSADFFNVAEYPEITFKSTSMRLKGGNYKLEGDLTIRGVTQSVTFDVEHKGTIMAMGVEKAGFQAVTNLNRFDFKLNWHQTLPEGIPIIGKDVAIELNLEMDKNF
jgi:polyisoprenoid-binding protein YceI